MLALLSNLPSAYLRAQLGQGLVVMVLGMLVVFLFLTILIGATKLMSKILGKRAKEEPKESVAVAQKTAIINDDEFVAAAIAAAVDKER